MTDWLYALATLAITHTDTTDPALTETPVTNGPALPQWLNAVGAVHEMPWEVLVKRIVAAMIAGLLVAGVFAISQRRPAGQALPMITTLVLLTMLVAMTTVVIGDSVARAFGLVGALSIVRFRTVVDDTRDTSFVIFAVVVGMALGAGHFVVCFVGLPLVSLAAFGLSAIGNRLTLAAASDRRLDVRVGAGRDPETMLGEAFNTHLRNWVLASAVSARQGTSIDVTYRVRLRNPAGMVALIKAISAIEGVQSVDLKE